MVSFDRRTVSVGATICFVSGLVGTLRGSDDFVDSSCWDVGFVRRFEQVISSLSYFWDVC